jgi:hypothetical protein
MYGAHGMSITSPNLPSFAEPLSPCGGWTNYWPTRGAYSGFNPVAAVVGIGGTVIPWFQSLPLWGKIAVGAGAFVVGKTLVKRLGRR